MYEQICMEEVFTPVVDERATVEDIFLDILHGCKDADKNCVFNHLDKGVISISFFDTNNMSFWVKPLKSSFKFEVKATYSIYIDSVERHYEGIEPNKAKKYVAKLSALSDLYLFRQIIIDVYKYRELEAKGRLFDCCHRFIECSDALDCTNPNEEFRMSCSYRRKLKRGIVFFGKNRNVD